MFVLQLISLIRLFYFENIQLLNAMPKSSMQSNETQCENSIKIREKYKLFRIILSFL